MGFQITHFTLLLIWELKVHLSQYQEVLTEMWCWSVSGECKCLKAFDQRFWCCISSAQVWLGSKGIWISYCFFSLIYPLDYLSSWGMVTQGMVLCCPWLKFIPREFCFRHVEGTHRKVLGAGSRLWDSPHILERVTPPASGPAQDGCLSHLCFWDLRN